MHLRITPTKNRPLPGFAQSGARYLSKAGRTLRWAAALLIALPAAAQTFYNDDADPEASLFERTVLSVESASPELRNEFASIALYYLSEAYWAEARKARSDADNGNKKLMKWAKAVQRQARHFSMLQESAAYGLPVRLAMPRRSDAIIEVGDQRVLLTHPRPSQQAALEAQILQQFCQSGQCYDILAGSPSPRQNLSSPLGEGIIDSDLSGEPVFVSQSVPHIADTGASVETQYGRPSPSPRHDRDFRSDLHWEFSDRGARCQDRGVELVFNTREAIAETRPICEALFQEINTVLAELQWQMSLGVNIDWRQLRVVNLPDNNQQLVLNRAEDSTLGNLPILARNPEILVLLRSWLAMQLGGGESQTVIIDADQYAFILAAN